MIPGIIVFLICILRFIKKRQNNIKKIKMDCSLYTEWLKKKQNGIAIDQELNRNGYKTIAIYGMGAVGLRLYEELRNSSVEVAYVIDRRPKYIYSELKICSLNDELQQVDAVIISLQANYEEIKAELEQKISVPIISVNDVIFNSK